ncbi:hypothetical protein FNV43_RR19341 [Rhamnella rubrinervis]|uniref:C2 domain-containing protein n=1 Tax=Rhamnella rubrinervis TaxID=2594499 RepID=A0A8K0GY84_9ROSA|nr:hypothetical protein FNV43_RR19341 [Rhamnella rubrinervis]
MGASQQFSSLSCELRIKQAKNIEYFKSTGKVFVRCYLSAGNNKRIQLNTTEIPVKSDRYVWDQSFSLECYGAEDCSSLKQESVVFELRWRSSVPVFGRRRSSQLLGRAEIPWKEIIEPRNMVLDKWVTVDSCTRHGGLEGVKPAKLEVGIRAGVPAAVQEVETAVKRRERRVKKYLDESCGCKYGHGHGCTCGDYEIFALVAALEAF